MEERDFSELLGYFIHESGYTNYEFARIVGINRVNIQRYLSGARVPNRQVFEKIVDELHLGNKEQEELFESYQCAFDGKDAYYLKKTIRNILENAADICGTEIGTVVADMEIMEKECETVHGRAALEKYIWSLLYHIAQSEEKQTVYCFVPAERQILGRSLPTLQKEGKAILDNIKIVHLVQLTKRSDLFRNHYHNLKVIRNLIPAYYQAGRSYETLYYYHDQPQLELYEGLLYPYYLIFADRILLIDVDLENALLINTPEIVKLYLSKIEKKYSGEGIKRLINYFEKEIDILNFETNYDKESETKIFFEYEPCFAYWIDENLLESIIEVDIPERRKIIDGMKVRIEQLKKTEKMIHYFTEEGVRAFVETGRCSNYPEELLRTLTEEERLEILERMIWSMNQEEGDFRIINRKYLKMTKYLTVFISDNCGIVFILQNESTKCRYIQIKESSICKTFVDYIKSMHDYEEVLSQEETKSILIKYRDLLRKK